MLKTTRNNMRTYSPEELITTPIICGECLTNINLIAPLRVNKNNGVLMLLECPKCKKVGAIELSITDRIPDEIVESFVKVIIDSGNSDNQ